MRKSAAGFTLIELLFTVGLIGIMLAIAVPSFASFISSYRATSAVNDLLESITLTRTEALKRGRRVTLVPNSASFLPSPTGSWTNGWTVFVDSDNSLTMNGTEVPIFVHAALPSSVTVAASDSAASPFGGANYVSYDGAGYPRTNASTTLSGGIVFTDKTGSAQNVRTLCMALFGKPRIVKTATTGASCSSG